MKEMKQDSSTIAWNAMGDEWYELAQADEEQAKISVAMAWLKKIPLYLYWELKK